LLLLIGIQKVLTILHFFALKHTFYCHFIVKIIVKKYCLEDYIHPRFIVCIHIGIMNTDEQKKTPTPRNERWDNFISSVANMK